MFLLSLLRLFLNANAQYQIIWIIACTHGRHHTKQKNQNKNHQKNARRSKNTGKLWLLEHNENQIQTTFNTFNAFVLCVFMLLSSSLRLRSYQTCRFLEHSLFSHPRLLTHTYNTFCIVWAYCGTVCYSNPLIRAAHIQFFFEPLPLSLLVFFYGILFVPSY